MSKEFWVAVFALVRKCRFLLCAAGLAILLVLAGLHAAVPSRQAIAGARVDYSDVSTRLTRLVEQAMRDHQLPAFSIALVDDQALVWAQGFGYADPDKKIPVTAATIYRVGSVSKLFTDIGVMQLVERGEVDLDQPITRYLPDFQPRNPFGKPITLRQLMSHRSGLLREPPVGNYFETTEPSLAATVRSLNDTALVYAPETHTKYSNAAIGTVGYVLERKSGQPFASYLQHAVLDPLGLRASAFEPQPQIVQNLARAFMWTYDERVFPAPTFQLGMAPAGSMYSTTTDLGRFVSVLFAGGRGPQEQVLKPGTLEEMWTPQFAKPGEKSGFGLGFHISEFEGRRMVSHGGAIYGFATQLAALPEDKLGAVTVTTMDAANAITTRIANDALRLMLAAKQAKPLPEIPVTSPIAPERIRELEGRYGKGQAAVDLIERNGELLLLRVRGGEEVRLRQSRDSLIEDGRLGYGLRVTPVAGAIRIGDQVLERTPAEKPAQMPERWKGLIGEYGWDHDTLYVLEKDAKLTLLIEWFEYDPLEEVAENVFNFPHYGLYDGEQAIFARGPDGDATQVKVSGVVFKRRPLTQIEGGIFRVKPPKSIDELEREALAAQPPHETGDFLKPDLVDTASLDPTIKLDIRYATPNDFLGAPVYRQAKAFLQRPAAEALERVQQKLKPLGYGLLIHDGYRPWYVTKMFWDATPSGQRIFVADPKEGSRHNRGCAVDLTLYELKTSQPVKMTGVYDEMSERSYAFYPGGTSLERWQRDLLRHLMESEGFNVYTYEWWHFDYKDWRRYPILNLTFEQLQRRVQP